MRRRDFSLGLFSAAAVPSVRAQERAKQHRIAIVVPAGPVASIGEDGNLFWRVFFAELRRVGDVEGQNLTVERYSGEGRPESYADLAREAVSHDPDLIVAETNPIAQAVRAVSGATPIVWIGAEPIESGLAASLAHPGGSITGVDVNVGEQIWGKLLQILKEAAPSSSKPTFAS